MIVLNTQHVSNTVGNSSSFGHSLLFNKYRLKEVGSEMYSLINVLVERVDDRSQDVLRAACNNQKEILDSSNS